MLTTLYRMVSEEEILEKELQGHGVGREELSTFVKELYPEEIEHKEMSVFCLTQDFPTYRVLTFLSA